MRNYLGGYAFTVITDHQSLRWLQKLETSTGQLARLFEIQQLNQNIKYRRGILNRIADALSRRPKVNTIQTIRCRWYSQLLSEVRRDLAACPNYRIQNDGLYCHILHSLNFKDMSADEQWKLFVPREQRPEILRQFHDASTAGHGRGVAKTIVRIAEKFY